MITSFPEEGGRLIKTRRLFMLVLLGGALFRDPAFIQIPALFRAITVIIDLPLNKKNH